MNERTAPPAATPPQPPAPRPMSAVSGRDREFLPAALEILETPPPPLPIAMIATISFFALAALVWSFFGRLDVHAVAPGKIETAGYSKVIEPLDPGKVAAIHVDEGQSVKAGDLLFDLDPAEANADALSAEDALNASLAEIDRRRYAIEAVRAAQAQEAPGLGDRDLAASAIGPKDMGGGAPAVLSPIETLAGQPELKIAWDEFFARAVPLARGGGVARRPLTSAMSSSNVALQSANAGWIFVLTAIILCGKFSNQMGEKRRRVFRRIANDLRIKVNKAVIAASCRRRNSSGANFAARSSGSGTSNSGASRGAYSAASRPISRRVFSRSASFCPSDASAPP